MSFFKRVLSSLSTSIQRGDYRQRIKKTVANTFYINLDVGKLQFPEKNKYRYPAPASREPPDFSLNFPVKSESLSNQRYAERAPRLYRESVEPNAVEYGTANPDLSKVRWTRPTALPDDPKIDPRNLWLFREYFNDISKLASDDYWRINRVEVTATTVENSASLRPGFPGTEEVTKKLQERHKQQEELEARGWTVLPLRDK
jgi:hypothetical protein